MVAKFVAFFLALVAAAAASDFSSFAYDVADPFTGDFKNQIEARSGDNVQGQYSLLEADGTRRTVDYTASAGGFNAVVRKDPALISAQLPLAARIAAPLPIAAPIARFGAPIGRFSTLGLAAPFSYPYARYY